MEVGWVTVSEGIYIHCEFPFESFLFNDILNVPQLRKYRPVWDILREV